MNEKNLTVKINVSIGETEVREWVIDEYGEEREITNQDYIDFVEMRYNEGYGCEAEIN